MPNIIAIDDDPAELGRIASILNQDPQFKVDAFSSPEKAVHFIEVGSPGRAELLVLAVQMEEVDCAVLVKKLKAIAPELPILLVTGDGKEGAALAALKAGATSFCPRQLLESDLINTVVQVLEVAQRMRYTHNLNFCPIPGHQAFVMDNELALIGPLIESLQDRLPRWSSRDRLQIGMAIEEALTNAMHHGNLEVDSKLREGDTDCRYYGAIAERKRTPMYCNRKVRVEAEFSDEHICIQISDEGAGFDPDGVPDPREEANLRRVSGRGLFLIRSFMDQVAHNAKGNQITMTKLRKHESLTRVKGE